jgi:hypothetical protein
MSNEHVMYVPVWHSPQNTKLIAEVLEGSLLIRGVPSTLAGAISPKHAKLVGFNCGQISEVSYLDTVIDRWNTEH